MRTTTHHQDPEASRGPKRILLVDDDPDVLQALTEFLTSVIPDIEIITAPDGGRAMVQLKRHRPHVVISDLQMPVLSGQDLVSLTGMVGPHTRFILISGGEEKALHKAKEDHPTVDAALSKPLDVVQLLREVSRSLTVEG